MSDENQFPSSAGLIGTGITATSLGGAIATVYTYHLHVVTNIAYPEFVEQAYQTIFTTGVTILAMVAHLVVRFILRKYFPQT